MKLTVSNEGGVARLTLANAAGEVVSDDVTVEDGLQVTVTAPADATAAEFSDVTAIAEQTEAPADTPAEGEPEDTPEPGAGEPADPDAGTEPGEDDEDAGAAA